MKAVLVTVSLSVLFRWRSCVAYTEVKLYPHFCVHFPCMMGHTRLVVVLFLALSSMASAGRSCFPHHSSFPLLSPHNRKVSKPAATWHKDPLSSHFPFD